MDSVTVSLSYNSETVTLSKGASRKGESKIGSKRSMMEVIKKRRRESFLFSISILVNVNFLRLKVMMIIRNPCVNRNQRYKRRN